jgi:hypothetical protein
MPACARGEPALADDCNPNPRGKALLPRLVIRRCSVQNLVPRQKNREHECRARLNVPTYLKEGGRGMLERGKVDSVEWQGSATCTT